MDDEQMKEFFREGFPNLNRVTSPIQMGSVSTCGKTNLDNMRGFEFGTFLFPRPKTEKVFFVDIHLERCLDSRKGKREKTATKLRTIPSNQRTSL